MSIIYDALKKVEKSTPSKLEFPEDKKNQPGPNIKIYLAYFFVILVGIALSKVVFDFFTPSIKIAAPAVRTAVKSPAATPGQANILAAADKNTTALTVPPATAQNKPEPAPKTEAAETKTLPSFVLNGVFFSEKDGYALINNQIVKEKDEIEGATVEKITADSVELKFEDKPLTLSTRSR